MQQSNNPTRLYTNNIATGTNSTCAYITANNTQPLYYTASAISTITTYNYVKVFIENTELAEFTIRALLADNNIDNDIVFSSIAKNQKLSMKFINEFYDKLDLSDLCQHQTLSLDFITHKLKDIIKIPDGMSLICKNQKLTEKFIINNINIIDWNSLLTSPYTRLSKDFIIKNIENIHEAKSIDKIFYYGKLTDTDFDEILNICADMYPDEIDWKYVSWGIYLSEETIFKYIDNIDFTPMLDRVFKSDEINCFISLKYGINKIAK